MRVLERAPEVTAIAFALWHAALLVTALTAIVLGMRDDFLPGFLWTNASRGVFMWWLWSLLRENRTLRDRVEGESR